MDELDRLNRLLDDLALERDPGDRALLSPDDARLAETAAMLKTLRGDGAEPDEAFVARLGAHLDEMRAEATMAEATETATETATAERAGERPPAAGLSRRGLLGRLVAATAGLAVGAGAGVAGGAAAAYERGKEEGYRQEASERLQAPLVPDDRGRWLDTGHNLAAVAPGKAVRFQVGAIAGYLVNPGEGRPVYALSATCTHMGCLLSWLDNTTTFLCPCHGAQYDASGAVLSGVARHPLPRIRVRQDHGGQLYIWGVDTHPTVTTLAPYTEQ